MKFKERTIWDRWIADGIERGLNRAYKHTDTPDRETIAETIGRYIWLEIDGEAEVSDPAPD